MGEFVGMKRQEDDQVMWASQLPNVVRDTVRSPSRRSQECGIDRQLQHRPPRGRVYGPRLPGPPYLYEGIWLQGGGTG